MSLWFLPDDPDEIEEKVAELWFIGEAWINDIAHRVDDAEWRYTVPLRDLHIPSTEFIMSPGDDDSEWAIHETAGGNHYVADCFSRHDNAPKEVREWRGPFTIKLVEVYDEIDESEVIDDKYLGTEVTDDE